MTAERKNLPNFCNIGVILFNSQIKVLSPASLKRAWAARQAGRRLHTTGSWEERDAHFWGDQQEEKAFVIRLYMPELLSSFG